MRFVRIENLNVKVFVETKSPVDFSKIFDITELSENRLKIRHKITLDILDKVSGLELVFHWKGRWNRYKVLSLSPIRQFREEKSFNQFEIHIDESEKFSFKKDFGLAHS